LLIYAPEIQLPKITKAVAFIYVRVSAIYIDEANELKLFV